MVTHPRSSMDEEQLAALLARATRRGSRLRRRRRALRATPAVIAIGLAALLPLALRAPTPGRSRATLPAPASRLVRFTSLKVISLDRVTSGAVVARISDPALAASELATSFARHGLHIAVASIPASPGLVGEIVGGSVPNRYAKAFFRDVHYLRGTCAAGDRADCRIGVVVSRGFTGTATIYVGRAARSGERYDAAQDVFSPGELLHCSGFLGAPVARAIPALRALERARGLTIYWSIDGGATGTKRAPRSGYIVSSGGSLSARAIFLQVDAHPLTPESPFFQGARAVNGGC